MNKNVLRSFALIFCSTLILIALSIPTVYADGQYYLEQQCVQNGCNSGFCEAPDPACESFFEQCRQWIGDDVDDLTECQVAQCMADGNRNSVPMYRDSDDHTSKDTDSDGIVNLCDNCLLIPNPDQGDTNGDGTGNVCDPQLSLEQQCAQNGCNSGICEAPDAACGPFFEQCRQWIGDDVDDLTECQVAQCMADGNNDSIPMYRDSNDHTSKDTDSDGIVNECDPAQSSGGTNPGDAGGGTPTPTDTDRDGKPDAQDNCPATSNSPQDDTDGDGIGDACDLCIHDANQNRDGSDCPKGDNKDTSGDTTGGASNRYTSPADSALGGGNCSLTHGEAPLNVLSYIPMFITLVLLRIRRHRK